MGRNEVVQYSIVALIILAALVWAFVKVVKMSKKGHSGCDCCSSSPDCKAKELKDHIRRQEQGCRDGRSARN